MRLKALLEMNSKEWSSFDFFPLVFLFFLAVLSQMICISTVLQLGLSQHLLLALVGVFSLATQAINSGEFSRVLGNHPGALLVSPSLCFESSKMHASKFLGWKVWLHSA